MNKEPNTTITHVRVTAPEMCRIHGWKVGAELPIRKGEINIPDKNGLEPWVESGKTPGLWLWLAETEYELITQKTD